LQEQIERQMGQSVTVLGGGFRGLVTCFLLARQGHEITLIEPGRHCGGVLRSFEWDGLYCDLGCHLFDNTDKEHTSVFLEMGGGADCFHSIELNYASKTGALLSDDISIVDLSADFKANKETWLFQLDQAGQQEGHETGPALDDALLERFGPDIAARLKPMVCKAYAEDWTRIDRSALAHGLFGRVRIADNATSGELKKDAYLDKVLAASSTTNPSQFYPDMDRSFGRNFYPASKGMAGFVENAIATLKAMGVRILTGEAIENITETRDTITVRTETGRIFSSAQLISTLSTAINEKLILNENNMPAEIGVPMAVVYLRLPLEVINSVTYVHDFNPDHHVFRASTPGVYGKQVDDHGLSYVCVECPARMDSDFYSSSPEEKLTTIMTEIADLEIIDKGTAPADFKILNVPKSYAVPAIGAPQAEAEISKKICGRYARFHQFNSFSFGKSRILKDALSFIENLN
tara:strand:- start:7 stop:1395 length:1389 start_codon:yes stop_codon:yes gene_type:complete